MNSYYSHAYSEQTFIVPISCKGEHKMNIRRSSMLTKGA